MVFLPADGGEFFLWWIVVIGLREKLVGSLRCRDDKIVVGDCVD